jgi:hypothetical protein
VVESQPSKLLVAGSIPVSRYPIFPEGLAPLGLSPTPSLGGGPTAPPPAPAGPRFARASRWVGRLLETGGVGKVVEAVKGGSEQAPM